MIEQDAADQLGDTPPLPDSWPLCFERELALAWVASGASDWWHAKKYVDGKWDTYARLLGVFDDRRKPPQ